MEPLHSHPEDAPQEHQTSVANDQAECYQQSRSPTIEFGYLNSRPPEGDSWDMWVIRRGIEAASRGNRPLDDRAAHYIAAQLHEGQASALYSFASSGIIEEPRIHQELVRCAYDQAEDVQSWIILLGAYCLHREDRGPVEGWRRAIVDQDRADLEAVRRARIIAMSDILFTMRPAEVVRESGTSSWSGLMRHDGQPGGLLLREDEDGRRAVWATDSDAELEERWSAVSKGRVAALGA